MNATYFHCVCACVCVHVYVCMCVCACVCVCVCCVCESVFAQLTVCKASWLYQVHISSSKRIAFVFALCVCVYVCECVCVVAVWCSGYVLGSGPEVPKFKPRSGNVHLIFHLPLTPPPPPLPTSPPSCDGDGYLVFAGVQIQ